MTAGKYKVPIIAFSIFWSHNAVNVVKLEPQKSIIFAKGVFATDESGYDMWLEGMIPLQETSSHL